MTEKLLSGFILVTMTLLSMPARSAEYEYEKPEDYETVTKDPLRFTEIGENVAEQAGGAALHNTADYVSIINKTFQNNRAETVVGEEYEGYGYTLLGGAVYNDGDIDRIKADFVANSVAADGADGLNAGGGALYNGHNGKITDVSGDFISNSASGTTGKAVGGAIFNQGKIEKINGSFVDNRADVGGAVFNDYEAEIGSIGGSFVNNSGGALYNLGKMGDVRADFVGNSGNAVYNGNRIGNIRGNFSGNRLTDTELNGGIVFNSGSVKSITGNFSGNEVSGNSVYGIKGGAVYNYQGTIGNIKGSFDNNRILAEYAAYGSAVFNDWDSKIGDITGNFSGNSVQFGSGSVYGGAVYNDNGAVIGDIRGDFVSNRVFSEGDSGAEAQGGAFFNNYNTSVGRIFGSFVNNGAQTASADGLALGGAVYTYSNMTFAAGGRLRTISGNYTKDGRRGKSYNAVFVNNIVDETRPTVAFDTTGGGAWIVNDSIEGGLLYYGSAEIDYGNQYNLAFKGNGKLNADGLTDQYISINNDIINAGEVTVEGTTLRFGAYQHEDKTAHNWDGHGRFLAALKADGTADLDAEAVTSLSLNNAAFDLYNKYQDMVNLKGWKASGNSFLHVDVDVENLTADMLNVNGNVEGTTKLVLYPNSDKDIRGESILFAQSTNDTTGNADSFKVWRVYRSPYMFETKYTKTGENANKWELEMNDTVNPDAGAEPDFPEINAIGKAEVAPEVIGYQSVTAAAVAQNANLIYNVMNKVTDNRLYCPGCGFYDYYWNGEAFHNLWVNPVYTSLSIKSPTEIDADVWGIEAGGDLQHDLNNKLGLFVSYRKGSYDMNGDGKHYYSTVGSEIDIDSYLAGLYYRYDRNNWYAFATLYGGIQQADIKTDDGVKSDTDGVEFGASLEAGYDYNLTDTVYLTPSLGVFYTQVNYDDATDSVGKKAEYNDLKQIELEAGVKLTKAFRLDEGYANVYVKPSVVQTLVDGDEVTITGLGKVNTLDDETLGRIELGGRYGFTDQLSAYGWANYTFGSDYDATTVGLGLNCAW